MKLPRSFSFLSFLLCEVHHKGLAPVDTLARPQRTLPLFTATTYTKLDKNTAFVTSHTTLTVISHEKKKIALQAYTWKDRRQRGKDLGMTPRVTPDPFLLQVYRHPKAVDQAVFVPRSFSPCVVGSSLFQPISHTRLHFLLAGIRACSRKHVTQHRFNSTKQLNSLTHLSDSVFTPMCYNKVTAGVAAMGVCAP